MTQLDFSGLSAPRARSSLATRLTWVSLLMVTLAIGVLGAGLIHLATLTQRQSAFRLQQQSAAQVAQLISSYMNTAVSRLRFFSQRASLITQSPRAQKNTLDTMLTTSQPLYSQISLLDRGGKELHKVSRFHTYLPQELGSQADSPAFLAAMAGETYLGPVGISMDSGLLFVTLAMPIVLQPASIEGVLCAEVNLSQLWQDVARIDVGRGGYAYLVDGKGHFVAYHKLATVMQRHGEDLAVLPPVAEFMSERQSTPGPAHEYAGLGGEKVIGAQARIPGTPWAVVVEWPTQQAYAGIASMQFYLYGLTLLAILLVGGVVLLVSRRLVRPIRDLTLAAQEMAQGNLDIETKETQRSDEVGALSQAFSHMQRELKRLYAGLEDKVAQLEELHQALRHSEAHYRSIIDNSIEGIFQSSPGGRVINANPAYCRMLGYESAQEVYQALTDLGRQVYVRPEDRLTFKRVIEEQGKITGFITQLQRKDGSRIWVSLNARAVRDENGHTLYYEGMIEDITSQRQAEEKLRLKTEELDRYFTGSLDLLCIADTQGFFRRLNPEWRRTLGYELHELENRSFMELVHPEDQEGTLRAVGSLAEGQEVSLFVNRYRRKDGTYRWLEWRSYPAGNLIYAVARDITERIQVEQALRESEVRFKVLSEKSPLGISLIDHQGRYRYLNPAFVRMFGYGLQQIKTGQDWFTLAFPDPEYRREVIAAWQEDLAAYPEGETRPRVFVVRCLDGGDKTIMFRPVTIVSHGQFVLYEDITERRKAEEEAKANENRLRAILEASADPVVVYDNAGRATYLNPAFTRVFGWQAEEVLGRTIPYVPEDEMPTVRRVIKGLYERGGTTTLETRRLTKNGEMLNIFLSAAGITDQEGRVTGMVVNLTDVTPIMRLEAQLRQAQKMEAIGTLAGGIAHDFNNILGAVIGYTELAQKNCRLGRQPGDELEQVLKAAERARNLVRQILTFSRKAEADLQALDLNKSVRETMQMLAHSLPKEIALEAQLDPDLKLVNADPNQMAQVIVNLASNAADAMPRGGRLVMETKNLFLDEEYCRRHLEVPPGEYVALMVSDTGQGMNAQTLEHIFEPFFTTKGVGKGTGLGLATVYGIVKGHRGQIQAYSEPGMGATFKIYLPAHQAGSESPPAAAPPTETQYAGKETILLVDDEDALRELGSEALRGLGYAVITARSGEEALDKYLDPAKSIDLVLLDLGMPGMGGQRCLERILAANPEAKVIIASGYAAGGQVKEALAAGAKGYVAKPFRLADLLGTVRQLLDRD